MFRLGMEKAGHDCVGYVEINDYARSTYEANFDTEDEWTAYDIRDVKAEEVPEVDIWCLGFPCKNFSTSNVISRDGLNGSQSGLFMTMIDLLNNVKVKPKYLFIENVRGFTTIDGGRDFLIALNLLHNLSYDIKYEISSAIDYNVPQNRIRTYLTCELSEQKQEKGLENPKKKTIDIDGHNIHTLLDYIISIDKKVSIKWGKSGQIKNGIAKTTPYVAESVLDKTLADYLDKDIDDKLYLTQDQYERIKYKKSAKRKQTKSGKIYKEGAVPFPDRTDRYARCITPSDGMFDRSTHIIEDSKGYRRLTIDERKRLQGLPKSFVFPVSNTQASLQLGNGVVVDVIERIAKREIGCEE